MTKSLFDTFPISMRNLLNLDTDECFRLTILRKFPFHGTQINYELLRDSRIVNRDGLVYHNCSQFASDCMLKEISEGKIICFGDSFTSGIVEFEVDNIDAILRHIIKFPQYYYFTDKTSDWVMVLTMTKMIFGLAPKE